MHCSNKNRGSQYAPGTRYSMNARGMRNRPTHGTRQIKTPLSSSCEKKQNCKAAWCFHVLFCQNETHLSRSRGSGRSIQRLQSFTPAHTDSKRCPVGRAEKMREGFFPLFILLLTELNLESPCHDERVRTSYGSCLSREWHDPRVFSVFTAYERATLVIYTTAGGGDKHPVQPAR